jgi:hypothetical protein
MTILFSGGVALFAAAFAVWNGDNELCHHLRRARGFLPLPAHAFLELHSLWHLLSGLGLYWIITFGVLAREVARSEQEPQRRSVHLTWGLFGVVPRVELGVGELRERVIVAGASMKAPQPRISINEPEKDSRHELFVLGEIGSNLRIRQPKHRHRPARSADSLGRLRREEGLSRSNSVVGLTSL